MVKVPHLDFLNLHVSPQFQFYMKQIVDALNNAGTGTVTHTAGALTLNNFVLGAGGADIKDAGFSIVPLTAGGTGSATKNFVDLTTTQSVAGLKTFSNNTRTIGLGIGTDLAIASKQDIADAGPAWASYSTIYDALRVSINGFPVTSEFGSNAYGIASAIVGAIETPSSDVAGNAGYGIVGYGRTSSTTTGTVGAGGFGLAGVNGVSIWGANFGVSNAYAMQPIGDQNVGRTNVVGYGTEINVNMFNVPGGGSPNFAVRGTYYMIGSDVHSLHDVVNAVDVDRTGSGSYGWKNAVHTYDGAALVGVNLGTSYLGDGVGSQPIKLRARNSGGANKVSTISADPDGNIILNPAGGVGLVSTSGYFQGNLAGNVTGNVSGSAATVTAAAQPAITSVGTLSGLAVTNPISGSVAGSATFLISTAGSGGTQTGNGMYMSWAGGVVRLWVDTTNVASFTAVAAPGVSVLAANI